MAVGSVATIWDREVAGMRLALDSVPVSPVFISNNEMCAPYVWTHRAHRVLGHVILQNPFI